MKPYKHAVDVQNVLLQFRNSHLISWYIWTTNSFGSVYVVNITHSEELEITLRYVLIDFDLAVCNHVCICLPYCISEVFLLLPYLTLRSREDVLPPGVEASNGPNVHPRISHKVK